MPDKGKPATGPVILEQLALLAEEVKAIKATQDRRERQLQGLSEQIDRFLASEIDLTGTLVQVREVVAASRDGVSALRRAVQDLDRTIHGTLALAAGDPGIEEREHNGG